LPISTSPLAEIVPTWAISSLEVTFFEFFCSLRAFLHDRLRQNRCGCGAVTGEVGGLRRDLAYHLRAHILELVLELDLLGDGNAVLGDARRAV
jgi:hypothetical protein